SVTISATGMALRCSGTFCPGSNRKPTTRIDPQSAICSNPKARRDPSGLCVDTFAIIMPVRGLDAAPSDPVDIVHLTGAEGARDARGTVVGIDVLRSFSLR